MRTKTGAVSHEDFCRKTRTHESAHAPRPLKEEHSRGTSRAFATTNCGKSGWMTASSHTNATNETAPRCARKETRCSNSRHRNSPGAALSAMAPRRTPGQRRKEDSSMLMRRTELPTGRPDARKLSHCSVAIASEKNSWGGFLRSRNAAQKTGRKLGPCALRGVCNWARILVHFCGPQPETRFRFFPVFFEKKTLAPRLRTEFWPRQRWPWPRPASTQAPSPNKPPHPLLPTGAESMGCSAKARRDVGGPRGQTTPCRPKLRAARCLAAGGVLLRNPLVQKPLPLEGPGRRLRPSGCRAGGVGRSCRRSGNTYGGTGLAPLGWGTRWDSVLFLALLPPEFTHCTGLVSRLQCECDGLRGLRLTRSLRLSRSV